MNWIYMAFDWNHRMWGTRIFNETWQWEICWLAKQLIYYLVRPLLPTYCSYRGLLLHLIALTP